MRKMSAHMTKIYTNINIVISCIHWLPIYTPVIGYKCCVRHARPRQTTTTCNGSIWLHRECLRLARVISIWSVQLCISRWCLLCRYKLHNRRSARVRFGPLTVHDFHYTASRALDLVVQYLLPPVCWWHSTIQLLIQTHRMTSRDCRTVLKPWLTGIFTMVSFWTLQKLKPWLLVQDNKLHVLTALLESYLLAQESQSHLQFVFSVSPLTNI